MWVFWWVIPLVGTAFAVVFLLAMIRLVRGGHGPMCMGHGERSQDDIAELRREIRELREELRQRRAS
jgi:TRAP-type C4-dicarboxylate transport system permease small subunit